MIAAYVRVSTYDQNSAAQKAEIKRWLKGNGHKLSDVTWYEDKETGKTLKRPGFAKMQEAIFAGEIKTVVVWKLDRLSRNQIDGINFIGDLCQRNVRLVSVTQQLDITGAMGRFLANIFLGIAEMELENIRERQSVGIAAAKKRGVYQGGQAGFRKANPQRAKELREQGFKQAEIASALEISLATVKRYLAA